MTRPSIVAAIKNAGFTLKRLSNAKGFSDHAVSVALSKPWPAVEAVIAETIGVPPQKIWPLRYSRKGVPIKRGGKVMSSGRNQGRPQPRKTPANRVGSASKRSTA